MDILYSLMCCLVQLHCHTRKLPPPAFIKTETMNALNQLQPTELLDYCRAVKADKSHERFCLELFRRAIAEKSQACWSILYQQYLKLVYRWTIEFARGNQEIGGVSVEEMAQDAFTQFWRSFSSDHLAKAEGMGSILRYLKSCVWTSVQQVLRKQQDEMLSLDDDVAEMSTLHAQSGESSDDVINAMMAARFWQVVDSCCASERERVIARLRFVDAWKPSEIVKKRPDLATDEKELFKLLRNLKDRLERNELIRELKRDMAA